MGTVRLMPTEEARRSLWDMSTCISRGIKENMQKKEVTRKINVQVSCEKGKKKNLTRE